MLDFEQQCNFYYSLYALLKFFFINIVFAKLLFEKASSTSVINQRKSFIARINFPGELAFIHKVDE